MEVTRQRLGNGRDGDFRSRQLAAKAMLAGDEDRWGVLARGVKTKLQEFLPHRG